MVSRHDLSHSHMGADGDCSISSYTSGDGGVGHLVRKHELETALLNLYYGDSVIRDVWKF